MQTEQLSDESANSDLLRELLDIQFHVNKLIGDKSHQLTKSEKRELQDLHANKNPLLIEALQRRQEGDDSIQIAVVGLYHDDFLFLRNEFHLKFKTSQQDYYFKGFLTDLRPHYSGNINELIRKPDQYLNESVRNYLDRTFFEIREIDYAYLENPGGVSYLKISEFRLKERILQITQDDFLSNRMMVKLVTFDTKSQLEIVYFGKNGLQKNCYLYLPNSDNLAEALEESGFLPSCN